MLALIHIEKTAGTTITYILRQSFGTRHCDVLPWKRSFSHGDVFSAEDLRRTRWLYPRLESIAGHTVKPFGDLQHAHVDVRFYTFLREPLARCVSHYQHQIQRMGKSLSFKEWIRDERYRNFQVRKLAGNEDGDRAIRTLDETVRFVGLLERFNESLVMLRKRFPDAPLKIGYQRRNVAADSAIKDRLLNDPAVRPLLVDANREDLKLYQFVTERLYPRQAREYGDSLEADVAHFEATHRPPPAFPRLMLNTIKRRLVYRPVRAAFVRCCKGPAEKQFADSAAPGRR